MSMIGRKGGEASGGNRNQNTQNAQNTQTTQFGGNEGGGGNR
jgi:general stress protein YciG